ncbi:hypothetical protein [Thiosulfativibrio zosterae]|uniref:Uncharacterized protein n=1 Tax=Thiosulfativibrio zosterae TaxID=2675053 RepID=A0A6F8PLW5_9GAMM|nr:hypothetical protein [Thiosulfativibrio zosterae]BBP43099.1 hypothetical protein THMIRHAT_08450 [Thiosulfativibrio zosterae]
MSQLVLEIKNEMVKERLLWLLQHFKKDELEIVGTYTVKDNQVWSDEYIEQNWRELIITSSMQPDYEKSSQFREEFGEYLAEKNK